MIDWFSVLITALTSGGLAGFGSVFYMRRMRKAEVKHEEADAADAQNNAIKSVQDIYQEIIEDLRLSRNEQKEQNHHLKDKIQYLEDKMAKLKDEIEQTSSRIQWLIPLTCCVRGCKDRVIFEEGKEIVVKKKGRKDENNKVPAVKGCSKSV